MFLGIWVVFALSVDTIVFFCILKIFLYIVFCIFVKYHAFISSLIMIFIYFLNTFSANPITNHFRRPFWHSPSPRHSPPRKTTAVTTPPTRVATTPTIRATTFRTIPAPTTKIPTFTTVRRTRPHTVAPPPLTAPVLMPPPPPPPPLTDQQPDPVAAHRMRATCTLPHPDRVCQRRRRQFQRRWWLRRRRSIQRHNLSYRNSIIVIDSIGFWNRINKLEKMVTIIRKLFFILFFLIYLYFSFCIKI